MSDNPNALKAVLLSEADTEQQREFAKMLAEECARADLQAKGHRCWFFVPTPTEYERLKKYNQPPNYDRCQKCGKGRLHVEVYHGNIGSSWNVVCSNKACDFKEYVSDDD
jgi:Pyruvate/2-oxoacid:ferredoxin oxidoreductase delta subunit